jgi:hypothetical protein
MKRLGVFSRVGFGLVLVGAGVGPAGAGVATGADAARTNAAPYLSAVRQFADQVLAHGRDVYGKPTLLFALLELHRAGGNAAFLAQAEVIGRNILNQRVRNGWFVPSQRHLCCRVANDESQALLHLAAALRGQPEAVPAFTGAQPFFQAQYGASTGRVYDSASIYQKTR